MNRGVSLRLPACITGRDRENGGKARSGADIHSGDTACLNAGNIDTVRAEVAEAGVEGGEVVDGMDADFIYISEVFEPDRDANEEGIDKHEGILGGDGSLDEA